MFGHKKEKRLAKIDAKYISGHSLYYPRIKAHQTLPGELNNAIQVLTQSNSKGYTQAKQPTGGGSIHIVDTSKIKGLFDMFHIDRP